MSARSAAALVGAAFLVLGLLGFVSGTMLFGLFRLSTLQNVVHLVLGAAGVASASSGRTATRFLTGAGVASLALWTLGVSGAAGWLPVNAGDNWLHLALGAGALALGYVAAAREGAAGAAAPSRL